MLAGLTFKNVEFYCYMQSDWKPG